MPGCAIAAIIGAVVMVFGVVVVAMLAAIALPAYQDYLAKSRVVQAYTMAQSFQGAVDEQREQSGTCPDNAALSLADDETLELGDGTGDRAAQAAIVAGVLDNGNCAIEITFANVNAVVDGKTLLLESTGTGWQCHEGTLDAKYRPGQCRTSNLPSPTESNP